MPAAENQRLVYRDKFRSLHYEAFQSWFEELVHALHPVGDFQPIRKTQGDGGLDGFVISSQLVYAVYAPARRDEDRDSETAAKIRSDFAKACSTLHGQLKAWIFVHNHPEGKLGQLGAKAISELKSRNPSVEITVLSIDGLWEKLKALSDETLKRFFGEKDAGAASASNAPEDRIPDTIKRLFDEAGKLAEADRDAEAKAKYEEAANHPDAASLPTFRLKARMGIASVLRRHDPDESRKLFRECLTELPGTASDRLREDLLGRLGELEAHTGNLLEAKAYLTEAQTLASRLGNKFSMASNLEALAALEDRHGRLGEAIAMFDQAAELLMSEYQRHDPETEKQALTGLGICLTNKSLTQKRQADLLGALSSLEQAIEWFRKGDIQDDHFAETLIVFAEAKFADEKWDDGLQALQESLQSAKKRDDYMGICKCLKLAGKLRFTFEDEAGALGNFAAALDLMRKRGRPDQLLDYLDKVARVAAMHGLKSEARKLLIEAKDIA
jgi:hypothetical protein